MEAALAIPTADNRRLRSLPDDECNRDLSTATHVEQPRQMQRRS